MKAFEIHDGTYQFNKSDDRRPWLVLRSPNDEDLVSCFPISGQNYSGIGFEIRADHEKFKETGLKKRCFVLDDRVFLIPKECLVKRRGKLVGSLLAQFREYCGI